MKKLSKGLNKDMVKAIEEKVNNVANKKESYDKEVNEYIENLIKDDTNEENKQDLGLKETDVIDFEDPFPLEPVIQLNKIVPGGFIFIEGIRWAIDIPNNIQKLMQMHIEGFCNMMYMKDDPIYSLHLLKLYKENIQYPPQPH